MPCKHTPPAPVHVIQSQQQLAEQLPDQGLRETLPRVLLDEIVEVTVGCILGDDVELALYITQM